MKTCIRLFYGIFFAGIIVQSCDRSVEQKPGHDTGKKNVIIETDMGLDDMRMIMAILADTNVSVQGIIVGTGSASLGAGVDNLIGMLETFHIETIPVFTGMDSPGTGIPVWRKSANTLKGLKFPPPRETVPAPLPEGWLAEHATDDIIALGPLTNIAGQISRLDEKTRMELRIWIPVTRSGNTITEWNLAYDPAATAKVFIQAGNLMLLIIPDIPPPEANRLFSGIPPSNPAAQWINDIANISRGKPDSSVFFDELMAAAFSNPDLLIRDDSPYSTSVDTNGVAILRPDANGNIHLLSFSKPEKPQKLLAELWREGPAAGHHSLREQRIPPELYLSTFHGHLGPYVVLGYRMGRQALEILDSDGHFDLQAEVHSILHPPFSCFIDGVQLGTGCTLGKRNIQVKEEKSTAWAVFTAKNGKSVTLRIRPGVAEEVGRLVNIRGVETAGKEMLSRPAEKLFVAEP